MEDSDGAGHSAVSRWLAAGQAANVQHKSGYAQFAPIISGIDGKVGLIRAAHCDRKQGPWAERSADSPVASILL